MNTQHTKLREGKSNLHGNGCRRSTEQAGLPEDHIEHADVVVTAVVAGLPRRPDEQAVASHDHKPIDVDDEHGVALAHRVE